MRPAVRVSLGTVAGAMLLAAMLGLSRVPWAAERSDHAVVRLAWRYRSRLVSACRPIPPEEQARLPVHMRRAEDCTRALVPYRLSVTVDGVPRLRDSIHAGGARADRPLSLFRELRLPAGAHRLGIGFEPYGAGIPLRLDTTLALTPRQVAVVTVPDGRLTVRAR